MQAKHSIWLKETTSSKTRLLIFYECIRHQNIKKKNMESNIYKKQNNITKNVSFECFELVTKQNVKTLSKHAETQ